MSQRERKRAARVAREVAREARLAVEDYVEQHRGVFGGDWFAGEGADRRFVVAFTDNPERHRAALAGIAGLEVVQTAVTRAELAATVDRVIEFFDARDDASWSGIEPDERRGTVWVGAQTTDEPQLRAALAEAFGDRLELSIDGPARWEPDECEFAGWLVDRKGLVLTVFFTGGVQERAYRLELDESRDTVAVTVRMERLSGGGAVPAVGYRSEVAGTLREPLGDRVVVDAVAKEPRERGRRYE